MKNTLALILTLTAAASWSTVYQLAPSDDIWVYENAVDPGYDLFLRIWGNGIEDRNPNGYPPGQDFSHGYLKFDLSTIPVGKYKVISARLEMTSRPAAYSKQEAIQHPLIARALEPRFDEDSWLYSNPSNPYPKDEVYGYGDPSGYSSSSDWVLPVRLNGNAGFGRALKEALAGDRKLAIGLTSSIQVLDIGGFPYRLYSRDFPLPSKQPRLILNLKRLGTIAPN